MNRRLFSILVLVIVSYVMPGEVYCQVGRSTNLPMLPREIPENWLGKSNHPRLFCTSEELAETRKIVRDTKRGQEYIAKQRKVCERFIVMADERLVELVPAPYSKIVYGLGMNLDPVEGKRMRWGGWDRPFAVRDHKGNYYPNQNWPDDGDGVVDSSTGRRYYFIAQANGHILEQLEQKVLPALADVYALEGSRRHAHTAAVLLDAISALYPTNRRGAMDYPTVKKDYDRGGRLDRPYYQVARGLMNFVTVIDLIASSGELEQQSLASEEKTIRENIAKNMLWDGGLYCLEYTLESTMLHNGHADYMRGAAMVGIMLGVREFAEPMFAGGVSMQAMLDINIDRNGFYYEVSPSYAKHAGILYVSIAELMVAAQRLGWDGVPNSYDEGAMELFLGEFFNRREVGGHIPSLGDNGPDRSRHDPMRRLRKGSYVNSDRYIERQINNAWVRLIRSSNNSQRVSAAKLLRDSYGYKNIIPPSDRWSMYHIGPDAIDLIEVQQVDLKHFETESVFYGGKGLALMRGGKGSKRYGSQLFFGPINNHGHYEAMTWTFFAKGAEWSFDAGYFNRQYRFGWTTPTVSHQAMVVGAKNYDWRDGTGYMLAWQSGGDVQWAMAGHDDAYGEQGARRYERLIGQVHNSATGELGYWLDVGRVEGGRIRDDSFHTQMQEAVFDIKLAAPLANRRSLYSNENFGKMLDENGRLKGYEDKGFYWMPPGDGYGFLGNPQEVVMPGKVRVIMTDAGFAKDFKGAVIVDMMGGSRRSLIRAQGPEKSGTISVPYILRRDVGDDPSVFAKVIQVVDDVDDSFVTTVSEVKVISEVSGAVVGAWCVSLRDGSCDLWYVGDPKKPGKVRLESELTATVTTDGLVGFVRFDSDGKVVKAIASKATMLDVAGKTYLQGDRELRGKIKKVYRKGDATVFDVVWEDGGKDVPTGSAVITKDSSSQAATWELKGIKGNRVTLFDVKPSMGTTEFISVMGRAGWYEMMTTISRFYASGKELSKAVATGKAVYRDGRFVGRIVDITKDGKQVRLWRDGKDVKGRQSFVGSIFEAGPGEKIVIPLNLSM